MTTLRPFSSRLGPLVPTLVGLLLGLGAASANAEYVRDEVRVNMRVKPGNEYRITRVLKSGDRVVKVKKGEWVQVRTLEGSEGWVPKGYVVDERPASVVLPELTAKLSEAELSIADLEAKLVEQEAALTELGELRESRSSLETENRRLSGASMWRSLATGAGIVLVGLVIGVFIPRNTPSRGRRIKL